MLGGGPRRRRLGPRASAASHQSRLGNLVGRGQARLLALRTELERRRDGWPPLAPRVFARAAHRLARRSGHDPPLPACKPLTVHGGARRRSQAAGPPGRKLGSRSNGPNRNERAAAPGGVRPHLQPSSAPHRRARDRFTRSRRPARVARLRTLQGHWHLPGETVRLGEPLVEAVKRVAQDELGIAVSAGEMPGYIEYPSHYNNGLDSPVGLTFRADVEGDLPDERDLRADCAWFTAPPRQHARRAKGVPRSPSGHRPGMTTARTCAQPARRLRPTNRISYERAAEILTKEARREALATDAADEAQAPARRAGRADMSPPRLA